VSSLRESLVNSCVAFCVCFVSRLPVHSLSHLLQLRLGFHCLDANFSKGVSYFHAAVRTGYQTIPINRLFGHTRGVQPFFVPDAIKKNRRTRFSKNGTRLIQLGLYVHVRVLLQRVNIPTLPIDKLHFLGGAKDFYPNFPKLARKVFVRFCLQASSHKDFFLMRP